MTPVTALPFTQWNIQLFKYRTSYIPFDHWWTHHGNKLQRKDVCQRRCAAKRNAYNILFAEAMLTSCCADRKRRNCTDELLHHRCNHQLFCNLDSFKSLYACFKAGEQVTNNFADMTYNSILLAREKSCSITNLEIKFISSENDFSDSEPFCFRCSL